MGGGRRFHSPPPPLPPARLLDQRHSYVLESWVGGETPGLQAPGSSHWSVIGRPGQLHGLPQTLQPQLTFAVRGAADQTLMVLGNVATYSRWFGWCGGRLGQGEPSLVEVMMVLISAAKYRFAGGHVSNHISYRCPRSPCCGSSNNDMLLERLTSMRACQFSGLHGGQAGEGEGAGDKFPYSEE